jgi:hypothetical protein
MPHRPIVEVFSPSQAPHLRELAQLSEAAIASDLEALLARTDPRAIAARLRVLAAEQAALERFRARLSLSASASDVQQIEATP